MLKSFTETNLSEDVTEKYKYEPGVEKVNLLREYGITGYVYESIKARTAQELYETDYNNVVFATLNSTYPKLTTDSEDKTYFNASDKLWLLSGDELKYYLRDMDFVYDEGGMYHNNLKTQTFRGRVYGDWWLRSPMYDAGGVITWSIDSQGNCIHYNAVDNAYGVRPAFKI